MSNEQDKGIIILLGLKGYNVGKVWEDGDRVIVEVGIRGREGCPYCGSVNLYRHGRSKVREVLHTWIRGRKVYLRLHRSRWKCCDCRRTFSEGRELLRPYSRLSRRAEGEVLWQLKERNFSQIRRELGIGYSTLRALLERNTGCEMLEILKDKDEIYLGIDEHSFRHQELVYTITEVKSRRVLGILRDDRIATLKEFLRKIPADKVKEVCIDMKTGLKKAVEALFPGARVVVDPFHVIADANKRIDEARRIEQELHPRKIRIPKKIFLVGRERLSEEKRRKVDALLDKYPCLKGFYWAKEKIRALYQQKSLEKASRLLDNIILNLKSDDDAELVRWGNTLKRWRDSILNHFYNHITNGFTEGCHTKIKMLKRISFGLRNVEVYRRKMLLGFIPSIKCFHTI